MEIKLNEKNTDDIETDMNNIRITEDKNNIFDI